VNSCTCTPPHPTVPSAHLTLLHASPIDGSFHPSGRRRWPLWPLATTPPTHLVPVQIASSDPSPQRASLPMEAPIPNNSSRFDFHSVYLVAQNWTQYLLEKELRKENLTIQSLNNRNLDKIYKQELTTKFCQTGPTLKFCQTHFTHTRKWNRPTLKFYQTAIWSPWCKDKNWKCVPSLLQFPFFLIRITVKAKRGPLSSMLWNVY
jgi:hypothetical protein